MILTGVNYIEGNNDCYGLARRYYKQNYDLQLKNYARPLGFNLMGLDLITENMIEEGFVVVDVSLRRLEIGDGIIMAINRSLLANHIGVYVGNDLLLHHIFGQKSIEEHYSEKWRKRTLVVVRHPDVTEKNKITPRQTINILDLLPPHVRNQNAS